MVGLLISLVAVGAIPCGGGRYTVWRWALYRVAVGAIPCGGEICIVLRLRLRLRLRMMLLPRERGLRMKTSDFEEDILRLRKEGETYDAITLWLAKNKGFVVSPSSIRSFLKRLEVLKAAKK
ncbi:hypothetical protein ALQ30_200007 [Pseudomonas syringae pv. persicae]|uniref:Uncharacterized protein n=2 Tax=Pseudomonas TaxID=286 RepID=A0A3M4B5X8_9PSED|nr:hypothetical protein ALQ30_200007 [Pseudomonas syringae pv. persicae]